MACNAMQLSLDRRLPPLLQQRDTLKKNLMALRTLSTRIGGVLPARLTLTPRCLVHSATASLASPTSAAAPAATRRKPTRRVATDPAADFPTTLAPKTHAPPSPSEPGFNIFQKSGSEFKLSDKFLEKYRTVAPPFGFNGLGEFVYLRTYSRVKDDGTNETWSETVERVVNGTFNLQKRWIEAHHLGWDAYKAQRTAQRMYDRIFHMKFLPPGRGLWAMGSPITEKRGLFAALNNCAFVSTKGMWDTTASPSEPFRFLMDASMLGVGVGFDTKGTDHKRAVLANPNTASSAAAELYIIPDSREGWVESVGRLIDSYFVGPHGKPYSGRVEFDYSLIRKAGTPIKGFGGVASGPDSLRELHEGIRGLLDPAVGQPLTSTTIVDIMNMIGKCVVAGNVRRTAEIAFGEADDQSYIELKNYTKNPHRAAYGWTSNNSVFCKPGMDYTDLCQRVRDNGEPGFFWLDHARAYSRMNGQPDWKDTKATGGNPCLEQTLESYELCCLVETFPHNHSSYEDYEETLQLAYLYAKTVTLARTHWPKSNRVMLRNRRVGCSMSGLAQFISARGLDTLRDWSERGYAAIQAADTAVSDTFAIPRSIKTTTIKPSGTVSLLAGATPGMHYPESRYCIRRVRLSLHSPLVAKLLDAGYHVEPAVGSEESTAVVSFPLDFGPGVRSLDAVSMWEQLALAAFLQRHWSDNQVSCTVTFDPEREGEHIAHALQYYQYQLKGISFLPRLAAGAYPQMPYEATDRDTYERMLAETAGGIVGVNGRLDGAVDPEMERYCENDTCAI
ncbi:ribonucleotide reductase [Blastocladiella britannica]|nr:ribonucleotide reductase [Blastocladiella britannica]